MALNNLWGGSLSNVSMPSTWDNFGNQTLPTGSILSSINPVESGGGGFQWGNFLLGDKNRPGALQLGLGTLSGIGNLYLGMKNYGVAKKQLQQQNAQFEKNYAAQQKLVNSQLEDRQAARVASNPSAYESVSSYMDRNRIQ